VSGKYDDILFLPHHVSTVHPPMPMRDRAAQFAPFSPLSAHGRAILETARRSAAEYEPQYAVPEETGECGEYETDKGE